MPDWERHRNEPDWLQARLEGVTSSEVPILFGVGYAGSSVFDLWATKTGLYDPEEDPSMRRLWEWGHQVEPLVARWAAEEIGEDLFDEGDFTLVRHPSLPLSATPDRTTGELPAPRPVELKWVTRKHGYRRSKRFQAASLQLCATMMCLGSDSGWVVACHGPGDLTVAEVTLPDSLRTEIGERVKEFWQFVEDRRPPSSRFVDGSEATARALSKIYKEEQPRTVELGPEWGPALDRLEEIRKERSALLAESRLLLNLAARELGNAQEGLVPGHDRKFKYTTRTGGGFEIPRWSKREVSHVRA